MVYYEDCALFFKDGEIRAKNANQIQLCHQTSYPEIVSRRGEQGILTPSGRVINDHVAFYFSPITGMAYTIHCGNVPLVDPGGKTLRQASMDDRVFFVANTEKLRNSGLTYWFSDIACNARAPLPKFENDLDKLESHIAWDLFDEAPIKGRVPEIGYTGVTKYFGNCDTPERYQNRKQRRMAEFLVQDAIPLSMFDCIITKSDWIREEVRRMMKGTGVTIDVHSKPGCYF
jgi:ssDNA thymidine ADP-ribosyltransferase, DarT